MQCPVYRTDLPLDALVQSTCDAILSSWLCLWRGLTIDDVDRSRGIWKGRRVVRRRSPKRAGREDFGRGVAEQGGVQC